MNFDWFSWGWSKKKNSEKKNSKWRTQKKIWVFKLRQLSIFFPEALGIGSWVSRINWYKEHQCGSTYMVVSALVVRLSLKSSKRTKYAFMPTNMSTTVFQNVLFCLINLQESKLFIFPIQIWSFLKIHDVKNVFTKKKVLNFINQCAINTKQ